MIWRQRVRASMVAVGVAVAASSLVPSAAWAAPTTQVVQGDVIRLVSVADWDAASRLLPGEPVQWDVAVSADAPDPGIVSVAVSALGTAPLAVDVSVCMTAWVSTGCPGGAAVVRTDWSLPRDGGEVVLTEFPDGEVAHVRLSITLAAGPADVRTDVRVHATGAGESAVVGPGAGALAATGSSPSASGLPVLGGLLLTLGIVTFTVRRRRRDEGGEAR